MKIQKKIKVPTKKEYKEIVQAAEELARRGKVLGYLVKRRFANNYEQFAKNYNKYNSLILYEAPSPMHFFNEKMEERFGRYFLCKKVGKFTVKLGYMGRAASGIIVYNKNSDK